MRALLPAITLLVLLTACGGDGVAIPSRPEDAVPVVRESWRANVWTPDSTAIAKAEYFPDSPRKFLIVTFRRSGGASKPYLYEGFPASMWRKWREAESAGRWYDANLKGNRGHFFRG